LFPISVFSFDFPQDHTFHKNFQVEWCYFVGNLVTDSGEEIGYELSFFKGMIMNKEEVFPVHFAVSLPLSKQHLTSQTIERRIGKLANYNEKEIRSGDHKILIHSATNLEIIASPRSQKISLHLLLTIPSAKEILHQGNPEGFSLKSNRTKLYSHYYSIPRLQTNGFIQIENKKYTISNGFTWMDHEWSEPLNKTPKDSLSKKENSWNWICLQMEDGSDIMVFNFQSSPDSPKETFGTYRKKDGNVIYFSGDKGIQLNSGNKTWKSPYSQKTYIIEWKIQSEYFDLLVEAKFPNQEFLGYSTTGNSYWEGSIRAKGKLENKMIQGQGYLELKGN
jgi:predicted secreted hydrolase